MTLNLFTIFFKTKRVQIKKVYISGSIKITFSYKLKNIACTYLSKILILNPKYLILCMKYIKLFLI